jgi:hypothetical protein
MLLRSLTLSQKTASSADTTAILRYFPLQAGYVWTYGERVVTATHTVLLQRRVTLAIQSRHQNTYVAHWDFQSGQTQLPNMRYRLVDDGIQQAQLTDDTAYTPYVYLLKIPLRVGTMWHALQGATVRITAVGVACVVPAGTFAECMETHQTVEPTPESRVETRQRFAPDIGLAWQQRQLFQYDTVTRIDTLELQKRPEPLRL